MSLSSSQEDINHHSDESKLTNASNIIPSDLKHKVMNDISTITDTNEIVTLNTIYSILDDLKINYHSKVKHISEELKINQRTVLATLRLTTFKNCLSFHQKVRATLNGTNPKNVFFVEELGTQFYHKKLVGTLTVFNENVKVCGRRSCLSNIFISCNGIGDSVLPLFAISNIRKPKKDMKDKALFIESHTGVITKEQLKMWLEDVLLQFIKSQNKNTKNTEKCYVIMNGAYKEIAEMVKKVFEKENIEFLFEQDEGFDVFNPLNKFSALLKNKYPLGNRKLKTNFVEILKRVDESKSDLLKWSEEYLGDAKWNEEEYFKGVKELLSKREVKPREKKREFSENEEKESKVESEKLKMEETKIDGDESEEDVKEPQKIKTENVLSTVTKTTNLCEEVLHCDNVNSVTQNITEMTQNKVAFTRNTLDFYIERCGVNRIELEEQIIVFLNTEKFVTTNVGSGSKVFDKAYKDSVKDQQTSQEWMTFTQHLPVCTKNVTLCIDFVGSQSLKEVVALNGTQSKELMSIEKETLEDWMIVCVDQSGCYRRVLCFCDSNTRDQLKLKFLNVDFGEHCEWKMTLRDVQKWVKGTLKHVIDDINNTTRGSVTIVCHPFVEKCLGIEESEKLQIACIGNPLFDIISPLTDIFVNALKEIGNTQNCGREVSTFCFLTEVFGTSNEDVQRMFSYLHNEQTVTSKIVKSLSSYTFAQRSNEVTSFNFEGMSVIEKEILGSIISSIQFQELGSEKMQVSYLCSEVPTLLKSVWRANWFKRDLLYWDGEN
ncbi:hypothetical protein EIN_268070 [Entamoeba invadens IP1]|uniref:Uncharacterized protein n=1 Tax=Entamoeba invadens IP1 TaxID=370355 RepID=A0A0A1U8B2_ENTIV|nr:hypothetical protein EIN_268070 [Entamoeba invadens IP1]ELP91071.1 hypothetical protein EIN_268070 [Entamoeba invadens IP1]|eukprot:XP_004257842.1 hypothetical protein EIN_268070 [Entamoeba invadens IP1]